MLSGKLDPSAATFYCRNVDSGSSAGGVIRVLKFPINFPLVVVPDINAVADVYDVPCLIPPNILIQEVQDISAYIHGTAENLTLGTMCKEVTVAQWHG